MINLKKEIIHYTDVRGNVKKMKFTIDNTILDDEISNLGIPTWNNIDGFYNDIVGYYRDGTWDFLKCNLDTFYKVREKFS